MLTRGQRRDNRIWLKARAKLNDRPPPLLPINVTRTIPYPDTWTKELRHDIRERDNYTCRICFKCYGRMNAVNTVVHHVNWDKNDCSWENLITLCKWCHDRAMMKRFYWYNHLYTLIHQLSDKWQRVKVY